MSHALIGRCRSCRGWKSMQIDKGQRLPLCERVTLDEARATPVCKCDGRDKSKATANALRVLEGK